MILVCNGEVIGKIRRAIDLYCPVAGDVIAANGKKYRVERGVFETENVAGELLLTLASFEVTEIAEDKK